MQVAHSFIDIFIQILSGGLILIMRMIYFYFIVSHITLIKGITIPLKVLVMSDSKVFIGYSSLFFKNL